MRWVMQLENILKHTLILEVLVVKQSFLHIHVVVTHWLLGWRRFPNKEPRSSKVYLSWFYFAMKVALSMEKCLSVLGFFYAYLCNLFLELCSTATIWNWHLLPFFSMILQARPLASNLGISRVKALRPHGLGGYYPMGSMFIKWMTGEQQKRVRKVNWWHIWDVLLLFVNILLYVVSLFWKNNEWRWVPCLFALSNEVK